MEEPVGVTVIAVNVGLTVRVVIAELLTVELLPVSASV